MVGSITKGFNVIYGVAFSPNGKYAYVGNAGSENVVIIDTSTNTVVSTITSGFSLPYSISFSPSGAYAYVANKNSNNVAIINTATNTVVNSIAYSFNGPSGVAISPSGIYTYVSNTPSGSGNIIVLNNNDQIANSITSDASVYQALSTPTLTPSSSSISSGQSVTFTASWTGGIPTYGASLYSSQSSSCNQSSTLVQQKVGLSSNTVSFSAITPSSNTYYCVYVADNNLSPEVISSINTDLSSPSSAAFLPGGTYAYVTNPFVNNIVVVNTVTNSVVSAINAGSNTMPYSIAISPSGTYAYVTNCGSECSSTGGTPNVLIIDTATNTITGSISTSGVVSEGVAFSPDGSYAYLAGYVGTNVLIINTSTNTVVGSFSGGIFRSKGDFFLPKRFICIYIQRKFKSF